MGRRLACLILCLLLPILAMAEPPVADVPPPELTDADDLFWEGYNRLHGRGRPRDPGASTAWFEPAAEQGHVRAQVHMAMAYTKGRGVEVDPKRALEWFLLAADAGHVKAQQEAGMLLLQGRHGIPVDRVEAAKWLSLALQAGGPVMRTQVPPVLRQLSKAQRRAGLERANAWREEKGIPVPERPATKQAAPPTE